MDKKKIAITSQVNGRVGINVPEMRFKKTWEKKGQKVLVDAEILEEIFYDPGVEYMFRQGILYIEDMDFKKKSVWSLTMRKSLSISSRLMMQSLLVRLALCRLANLESSLSRLQLNKNIKLLIMLSLTNVLILTRVK